MSSVEKKMNLDKWKEVCKTQQNHLYNQLGDRIWDNFYHPHDDKYLIQKISIPLYGKRMEECVGTKDTCDENLTDEERKTVYLIRDKFIEHSFDRIEIRIAVIFAFVYIDETTQSMVPIFRVMSHNDTSIDDVPKNVFIDHLGRVYDNWAAYKDTNTWEMSRICVPEKGFYSAEHNYDILDQSSRGEVTRTVDKVTTGVNIVTGLTMFAGILLSFFPPTAPIGATVILASTVAGAPGAIYGVGRSIEQIHDRYTHEQSISLANSEARQCWLLTASSILSIGPMASSKLISNAAEAGEAISAISRAAVTTLNVTTSTVAGLGIVNSIYELSTKKDKITSLDILQLTTSIFFFTHSVVTLRTAGSIIEEAQQRQINRIRDTLPPEHQAVHDALLESSKEVIDHGDSKNMHGQAKFIREMKVIEDKEEFYNHFDIQTDGQLYVNSELTIHPRAFIQMSVDERNTLLMLSKKLSDKEIDLKTFNKEAVLIQKRYGIKLDQHRENAEIYLRKVFETDNLANIELGGTQLGNYEPRDLDRLENVVKNSFHDGNPDIMRLVNKFAQEQGTSNVTEYCAAGEYAVRKVDKEVSKRMLINTNPPRPPKMKAKFFYRGLVAREFLEDPMINELSNSFNDLKEQVNQVNVKHPRFNNSMAATNHYDKHAFFPKINKELNLSPETYFNIATEMAGGPIEDVVWTQDGSSLKCTFKSSKYEAIAIRYDNLANRTSTIATLMANPEESRLY